MPEITYMRIIKKYLEQESLPPKGIMRRFGQLLVNRSLRQIAETMGIDIKSLKKHEYKPKDECEEL